MMKQVGSLIPGEIFTYAKEKFVVLGPKNNGIHILRAQSGSRWRRCGESGNGLAHAVTIKG